MSFVSSPPPELASSVASAAELSLDELAPYDAVYLGSPYCRRVAGNLAEDLSLLHDAVAALRRAGKKAYVTTPAAPRGKDLDHVARLIEAAAAAGADALEVHNMGVLRMLRAAGNPLPAHMGAFANVYTHLAAQVMCDYGAVRVRPNAEVSLEEMGTIAREGGVKIEILVHGKIPLGVTDGCFLLEGAEDSDPACPDACRRERWLHSRQWVLKTVGKGVLSGKDMCMLEHLPALLPRGFCAFRIEGLYESGAYRAEVGRAYREALAEAAAGGDYTIRPDWAQALRRHNRHGFCNGYYFGRTGREYVGAVLHDRNV